MADVVSEQQQGLAREESPPAVSRHRFGLAYLALAAVVGAAVGLIVIFATRGDHPHGPRRPRTAPEPGRHPLVRVVPRAAIPLRTPDADLAPRRHRATCDHGVRSPPPARQGRGRRAG